MEFLNARHEPREGMKALHIAWFDARTGDDKRAFLKRHKLRALLGSDFCVSLGCSDIELAHVAFEMMVSGDVSERQLEFFEGVRVHFACLSGKQGLH